MVYNGSEKKFLKWLDSIGITNSEHKRDCFKCMEEWLLSILYDLKIKKYVKIPWRFIDIDTILIKIEFVTTKCFPVYLFS